MTAKLLKGDCFELVRQIPDKSVDLVLTDPPYDIEINHGGGSINRRHFADSVKDVLKMSDGYDIRALGEQLLRVCKLPNLYFFCGKKQIPDYLSFYVGEKGLKFDVIVWRKTNPVTALSNKYLTDCEYCLYFRKGDVCRPQSFEDAQTVFESPRNQNDKRLFGHPTIKPLELVRRLVRNSSKNGDTVLDCFMGSGTTGVACKAESRNFIGFEIDENYFEIATRRIDRAYSAAPTSPNAQSLFAM